MLPASFAAFKAAMLGARKVAYIDRAANSDANALARQAADQTARGFKCGIDKVQVIGQRGRAIEAMASGSDGEKDMP